jgi:hypothetical protein
MLPLSWRNNSQFLYRIEISVSYVQDRGCLWNLSRGQFDRPPGNSAPFGPQLLKEGIGFDTRQILGFASVRAAPFFDAFESCLANSYVRAHFLTSSSSLMSVASIAFPERLDMRWYHGHAFGRGRRSRGTAVGRVDPLHGDGACRLLNRSCAAACADMLTIEEGKRYLGIMPA